MKVLIFTEAGTKYGFGHLMRCLAIAHGFREKNLSVQFYIRGDVNFSIILRDFAFKVKEWQDTEFLKTVINNSTIAVADSYYTDIELCSVIYESAFKTLFLDDYNRIKYPGGYVLNGALGAEDIKYPENNDVIYLLGTKFQPMRKEFWEVKEFEVRTEVKNILITFGGSDITHQTVKYMNELRSRFPVCHLSVVVGPGFEKLNIDTIKNNCDALCTLVFNPEANDFICLMLESDFAVSGAGQTLNELARVGLPTYSVKIAENQSVLMYNWQKSKFLLKSLEFSDLSKDVRLNSSSRGKHNIDGIGIKRVVEILL